MFCNLVNYCFSLQATWETEHTWPEGNNFNNCFSKVGNGFVMLCSSYWNVIWKPWLFKLWQAGGLLLYKVGNISHDLITQLWILVLFPLKQLELQNRLSLLIFYIKRWLNFCNVHFNEGQKVIWLRNYTHYTNFQSSKGNKIISQLSSIFFTEFFITCCFCDVLGILECWGNNREEDNPVVVLLFILMKKKAISKLW